MEEELFYQIALTKAEFIGDKLGRILLRKFGSVKNIFNAPEGQIADLNGFGKERMKSLKKEINKKEIEKEIEFITKNNIQTLFINNPEYPQLLKDCPDAPLLLYYKGNISLNNKRTIAIVGTRTNTDYGRQITEELIAGFRDQKDVLILSGLAYGIDTTAHKNALKNGLSTVGVLAHGLDRIYPAMNTKLAGKMLDNGGWITEFPSGTIPDKQNFPQRNRIVAGMAQVTVVIETGIKGGSMITAKLACAYNREVATFPGRVIDPHSAGCNYLIQTNIAQIITKAEDLKKLMNWEEEKIQQKAVQLKLFDTLDKEEKKLVEILKQEDAVHIDELTLKTAISDSKIASILLSLELNGIVRSLPGKRYRLV